AHGAGYRACRRCLPEAVPGSPEWNVREDTAARAMRLIADGVVDREGVAGLSLRLGYSERQLGRILSDELGAGALQLARAQRAQNARQLLVATPMPVSDVAFAAGFSSIRQFNDTMGEVFGLTPTALRGAARVAERGRGAVAAGVISVRLAAREPFDGAGALNWLAFRAVAGLECVVRRVDERGVERVEEYTRAVRLDAGAAVVTLRAEPGAVALTASLEHLQDLPALLARVRRLLDLDADPDAVDRALSAEPLVAPSVATSPGIRIPGSLDATEMLTRAVLGQQVSVAAARKAVERVVDALGEPLPASLVGPALTGPELADAGQTDPRVDRLFPTARALAESVVAATAGPVARREALARAAGAIADGDLSLDVGQTREDFTAGLEALPGIGPWTSNYVALRVLGSTDVLLTGDSAVRAGAKALGLPSDARELAAAVAPLAPWRSYLMMHLWRASAPLPSAKTRTPSGGDA
ncbi:MAG: helix-turn-helix domain-containing protein, partial [Demequinaceae bacterium]|nr:helix-turn-helix domain-containing protein [Demequinaceae bacterium]